MNNITCPGCGRDFTVVWTNDGLGPPEYCPMCGVEIDYWTFEEEKNER